MSRKETAMNLFRQGYNCSQAVLCAFSDKTELDDATAQRIASSFGGGMGRLREVCGAVSGMFMVAGLLYGYDHTNPAGRGEHYALIQRLAGEFKDRADSIVCRELLAPDATRKKPACAELVGLAAELTEQMIDAIEN